MKKNITKPTKKKKFDSDSSKNQEIKGRFVKREVLTCFSYEMEAVLQAGNNGGAPNLPSWDQIENFYEYKCPECGEGISDLDEFEYTGEIDTACKYRCPNCKSFFQSEPDQQPQEIYEWWIVTPWLHGRLKDKGEAVLEWGNNCYWGRCTTGQAIFLDGIITNICRDMEILEGQKNEWSVEL